MAVSTGGGSGGGGAIRAGRAFVELFAVDKATSAIGTAIRKLGSTPGVGLKIASQITGGIGSGLKSAGGLLAKTGGGLLAGGTLAGGLLGGKIGDTISEIAKIGTVAKAFGTTAEGATGLFGALKAIGSETKENIEGLVQFNQKVQDAFDGKGEQGAKLFDGLSVSAKDIINLPIEEKFYRVHEAIRQLDQGQQESRLAMLGGSDSLKQWQQLLAMSTVELRASAKAQQLSTAEVEAATAAQRALTGAGTSLEKVWQKLAVALAPTVKGIADSATASLGPMAAWVGANRESVVAGAAALAGITVLGGGLLVTAAALTAAGVVLTTVATGLGLLASPAGLAAAGVGYLGYQLLATKERGDELAESFAHLKDTATAAWGGIADALKTGDLGLAAKIGAAGVETAWADSVARMTATWETFKANFNKGWEVVKENGGNVSDDLATDFAKGITRLQASTIFGYRASALFGISQAEANQRIAQLDQARQFNTKNAASDRATGVDAISADLAKRLAEIKSQGDAAVAKGRAELEALRVEAMNGANLNDFFGKMLAGFPGGGGGKGGGGLPSAPDLGKLGSSILAFGGFGDLSQTFGNGGGAVLKDQLKVQKDIDKGIKQLNDNLKPSAGLAGETFV